MYRSHRLEPRSGSLYGLFVNILSWAMTFFLVLSSLIMLLALNESILFREWLQQEAGGRANLIITTMTLHGSSSTGDLTAALQELVDEDPSANLNPSFLREASNRFTILSFHSILPTRSFVTLAIETQMLIFFAILGVLGSTIYIVKYQLQLALQGFPSSRPMRPLLWFVMRPLIGGIVGFSLGLILFGITKFLPGSIGYQELFPFVCIVALFGGLLGWQIMGGMESRMRLLVAVGQGDVAPNGKNRTAESKQTDAAERQTEGNKENSPPWERLAMLLVGIVFIAALMAMAVIIETPTDFQTFVFRVVLALGAGALGGLLPGSLEIKSKWLVAGGAAGFFVLVYLVDPGSYVIGAGAMESK